MAHIRGILCLLAVLGLLRAARAACPLCPSNSIQCTDISVTSSTIFELSQSDYVHRMRCTYILDAGPGHFSRVTFNAFDSVRGVDYLRLYDGSNETATPLFSYSGPGIPFPATFSASQRYLYISWKTSNGIFSTGKGWILNFVQDPGYIKVMNNAPKTVYANSWAYLTWDFKGLSHDDTLIFGLTGKDFGALGAAKAGDGKINLKVPPYPTVLNYFTFAFTITSNTTKTIAYSTTFPFLPSNSYLPNPDNVFVGVYVPNATCLNLGTGVKSLEIVLDDSERPEYNVSGVYIKKGACPSPTNYDDVYAVNATQPLKELNHVLAEFRTVPLPSLSEPKVSPSASVVSDAPSFANFAARKAARRLMQQEQDAAPETTTTTTMESADILSVNAQPTDDETTAVEPQDVSLTLNPNPETETQPETSSVDQPQVNQNEVAVDDQSVAADADVDGTLQEANVLDLLFGRKEPQQDEVSHELEAGNIVREANTVSPDDIFVTVLLHSDLSSVDSSDFLSMNIGYSATLKPSYTYETNIFDNTPFEVYIIMVTTITIPLCALIALVTYRRAWKSPHQLSHGDIVHPGYKRDFYVGLFVGFFLGPLCAIPLFSIKSRKFRLGVELGFGALCFVTGIVMLNANSLASNPCYTCCQYFGQTISSDTDMGGNPFCYYYPFVEETQPPSPQCYLGETYENCWTPTAWKELEIAVGVGIPLVLVGFYILVFHGIEYRSIFLYRPHPGDIEAAEAMKGHHDIQHVSFDKPTGAKYKEGRPTIPSQVVLLDYVKQKERESMFLKREIASMGKQLKAEQKKNEDIARDNQRMKEEQTRQKQILDKLKEELIAQQQVSSPTIVALPPDTPEATEPLAEPLAEPRVSSPESTKNLQAARAKFERALAVFKKCDGDSDGCLTLDEAMEAVLMITNQSISKAEITIMLGEVAEDEPCITIAELIKILQSKGGAW